MSSKSVNLPRISSGDDAELNRLVNLLEVALNGLQESPLAGAQILAPVSIALFPAQTRVYHGLGQRIKGWFVVNSTSLTSYSAGAVPESIDPTNFFTLSADNANITTLAVF